MTLCHERRGTNHQQSNFRWDSDKAALNWQKHTVTFEDATLVFADDNRIERFDEEHSDEKNRYVTIGKVESILFVIYAERGETGEIIRLISARRATSKERRDYYAGNEDY